MAAKLLLDTNVLVRFFTGEPPRMALAAKALVESAASGEVVLEVLPLILAETVYTLESFYEMDRKEVASSLIIFLQSRGIKARERERVLDALRRHKDYNIHFADAYLAATGAESGVTIASFDRDLDKFKDVQRLEPKS